MAGSKSLKAYFANGILTHLVDDDDDDDGSSRDRKLIFANHHGDGTGKATRFMAVGRSGIINRVILPSAD